MNRSAINTCILTLSFDHLVFKQSTTRIVSIRHNRISLNNQSTSINNDDILKDMEINHISISNDKRRLMMATSLGNADLDSNDHVVVDFNETGYVYIREIKDAVNCKDGEVAMIQVNDKGSIGISSVKNISFRARFKHGTEYWIDNRDFLLDDDRFYFVNDVHEISVVLISDWIRGKKESEIVLNNVLRIYKNIVAFSLQGNFMYVLLDDCNIILFRKVINNHDSRRCWDNLFELKREALSEKGLKTQNLTPTAICASKRYTSAIYYDVSSSSLLIISHKSLKSFTTCRISTDRRYRSPCYRLIDIAGHINDMMIAAFDKGCIAVVCVRKLKAASVGYKYLNGVVRINGGLMVARDVAVLYGKPSVITVKFKVW